LKPPSETVQCSSVRPAANSAATVAPRVAASNLKVWKPARASEVKVTELVSVPSAWTP
jgi:hypothetical protein